jgi:hypothetical protein
MKGRGTYCRRVEATTARFRAGSAILLLAVEGGVTRQVSVGYTPPAAAVVAAPNQANTVSVGAFVDTRGGPSTFTSRRGREVGALTFS